MRVSVVINPRAGAGSAARQLPALRKGLSSLGIEHEFLETRGPGHATSLAIQAIERGCTLLGVVGGDGTLNEVSQAYVEADGTPRSGPPLALLPCGTGGVSELSQRKLPRRTPCPHPNAAVRRR